MNLKISRILHAGYLFQCGHFKIMFDPLFENPFSRNCYAFPSVRFDIQEIKQLQLDAVFISHYHDDHFSMDSLSLLNRSTPIYMYCVFEELFSMIKELGFSKVHSLEIDKVIEIGTFSITPRRALDADVDSIFQIQAAGLNILNVVDSWIDPITLEKLIQQPPWDMLLWPFQTMREIEVLSPSNYPIQHIELPPEWLPQLEALKPKYLVPSSCQFIHESWSWYNHALFPISYQYFKDKMKSLLPETHLLRLDPSMSVVLNTNTIEESAPLDWIQRTDNAVVDYSYHQDLRPTATADIAKHFPALTEPENHYVYDYCQNELIQKFNSMSPPVDFYFEKPRHWRLSLYDHRGQVTWLHYRIENNIIALDNDRHSPISWSTEVPISKLYAALKFGESLTSMYIRINDIEFTSGIKSELQNVDILEDPLVRCLFNGVIGAYQRAQLNRIQKTLSV